MIPFGLETIPWGDIRDDDILIVAEGESDCLACREHIAQIGRRRVFCIGLPGASSWKEEWLVYLQPFVAIYVIGDGDDAGRGMGWRVRPDCRWVRIVELPEGDDLRAVLQRDGTEALLPLMDEATRLLQLELGWRRCSSLEALDQWMARGIL